MPWTASSLQMSGAFVVDTKLVAADHKAPAEITHYEIYVDEDPDSKIPTVLVTRDVSAYERALQAEGTDQRFDVSWRRGYRPDGRKCLVLARFEPAMVARGVA